MAHVYIRSEGEKQEPQMQYSEPSPSHTTYTSHTQGSGFATPDSLFSFHDDLSSTLPPPYERFQAPDSSLPIPVTAEESTTMRSKPQVTPNHQYLHPDASLPIPVTTPEFNPPQASKIIAVPATTARLGSPFLRAYPPSLAGRQIARAQFLGFLDQLNRASVASPPVQAIGLAGNIVGMVPLATAQIVGAAVDSAAKLTTVAMSKGRTEMVLRQANREIFGPRGLKVYLAKLDALARLANLPILDASGKIDTKSSLLGHLEDDLEDSPSIGVQERRIAALGPWISPLDVESLPPVEKPTNPLSRMHAAVSERQRSREEEKLVKNRNKMAEDWDKGTVKAQEKYDKGMRKLARKECHSKLIKHEWKHQKIEQKYQRKLDKVERDRQKDDKEEKVLRKLLFLIIDDAGTSPARDVV